MNSKNLLMFIGGVIVGAVAGVLGTKKYFQKKCDEQCDMYHQDLEKYYKNDELKKYKHGPDKEKEFEDDQNEENQTDSTPGGRMSSEERKAIKGKFNELRSGHVKTDYAAMYKEKGRVNDSGDDKLVMRDPEENIDEEDQSEEDETTDCRTCFYYQEDTGTCAVDLLTFESNHCEEYVPVSSEEDEEAFNQHQRTKNKKPKIISAEDYSSLPAHIDQDTLYFYSFDEVLVDDNDDEIEDPALLVEDALTKYNFAESDERVIFVMNYATETCYEIQKVDASWEDSH